MIGKGGYSITGKFGTANGSVSTHSVWTDIEYLPSMIFPVTSHDTTTSKVMKIVQVRTIFIWHQCNNDLFQRNLIGVLKLSFCDYRTGRQCRAEDWADTNDGCGESRNYCGVDMCCAGKSTSNLQVLLRFIYIHDLCKICENFTVNCLGAVWVCF